MGIEIAKGKKQHDLDMHRMMQEYDLRAQQIEVQKQQIEAQKQQKQQQQQPKKPTKKGD
jgi:hypothetical protein